jgi:hypothetical protein
MEDSFVAFLLADSTVAAEIGDRLYPEDATTQDVKGTGQSYGVYSRVDTRRDNRRLEDSLDRLPRVIVELVFYGKDRKATRRVAREVRQRVEGFHRGLMNNAIRVQQMRVEIEQDGYSPPTSGKGIGEFSVTMEVSIAHDETE